MRPLALIACVAWLSIAGAAAAQTLGELGTAMAINQNAEQNMAAQARGVTKSAIATVFGATAPPQGSVPAPAGNAGAWAAEDARAAAGEAPAAGEPALAGEGVEGQPAPAAALGDGRRDPFRPFTLDLQRSEAPEAEILSPLQRYEIAQLKLTGLVLDMRPPRAMLQDNSGMGYIVTPGTPIGRRHGVVKSIEPGRLVVEEIVLDYYGRQQPHQVVVEMPRDDKKDDSGVKR
ncbi:pilus assembly protein PilP [bacterium]|nr:pilus assembly protein PilP [bacterium]